jgi:hypothetical protein
MLRVSTPQGHINQKRDRQSGESISTTFFMSAYADASPADHACLLLLVLGSLPLVVMTLM